LFKLFNDFNKLSYIFNKSNVNISYDMLNKIFQNILNMIKWHNFIEISWVFIS